MGGKGGKLESTPLSFTANEMEPIFALKPGKRASDSQNDQGETFSPHPPPPWVKKRHKGCQLYIYMEVFSHP